MKTWTNGTFIEGNKKIDSFNYAFHYASPVVWEGIRSYKQNDGSCKIWKLKEHMTRLHDSAKILGFEIPYSVDELVNAAEKLVQMNGNEDFYLRPIAYSEQDAESVRASTAKISVDIYCVPVMGLTKPKEEAKMIISNVTRGYPQYQMQAKTPANYSVIQMIKQQVQAAKVDDAFLVDNQGYIVEATVANFFVIKGDLILTPPNNGSILPGITRNVIAELLMNQAFMFKKYKKVPLLVEKDITKADLYTADCVIMCGTYMEVLNVTEIDGRKIGTEDSHYYYKLIKNEYTRLVRGIA